MRIRDVSNIQNTNCGSELILITKKLAARKVKKIDISSNSKLLYNWYAESPSIKHQQILFTLLQTEDTISQTYTHVYMPKEAS